MNGIIGCFALLAAGIAAGAQAADCEFAADGVRGRIVDLGGDAWRLQTAGADGAYEDRGAVQALKAFLGDKGDESGAARTRGRAEVVREPFAIRFYAADGRLLSEIDRIAVGNGTATVSGRLEPVEGVFGGGCRLDRIDKRGTAFTLNAEDGWNRSDTTYLPIPLFSTSRGGGFFVNSYAVMTMDAGKAEKDRWTVKLPARNLDVYFFTGGRLGDVQKGYHRLAGLAAAPKLAGGPVVCRHGGAKDFNTFAKIRRIYDEHVKAGVKPAAMIIEPFPIKLAFENPETERELAEMGGFFRKEGVPMMIWMQCGDVLSRKAKGFKDDYLVRCDVITNGLVRARETADIPSVNGTTVNPDAAGGYAKLRMLDITNPEAWAWYAENVLRFLVDHNVLGAKIDFCELLPDGDTDYRGTVVRYRWRNPEVFRGAAVHHAYPSFFNAKFYREMRRLSGGRADSFVFCRGGGIGCQLAPYYWAGDQTRIFPKLRDQLLAVLNSRLSGLPYMSYDMGGYQKGWDGLYTPERDDLVFARAAGFTKYMPLMQTHGAVKNFFEMRRDVREIYAKAVEFNRTVSLEVMPLVELWPGDPRVWNVGDEFMYGPTTLVAPLLGESGTRKVYLPEGIWTDTLTGARHEVGPEGRTVEVTASPSEVPVFTLHL